MAFKDGSIVNVTLRQGERGDARLDFGRDLIRFQFEDNDNKADRCEIKLDNFDLQYTDDPDLRQGNILEVSWGYPGDLAAARQVVIKRIKGFQILTVEGLAKSVLMNREQKMHAFIDMTRSEAVIDIANENGFRGNLLHVQGTAERVDCLNMTAETDARFLARLAQKEGFIFYVDHTGLHWHDRRFGNEPRRAFLWYREPGLKLTGRGAIIGQPTVDSDLAGAIGRVKTKAFDPSSKKNRSGTGSDSDTKRQVLGKEKEVYIDPTSGAKTVVMKRMSSSSVKHSAATSDQEAKREADVRYKRAERQRIKMSWSIVGDSGVSAKAVYQLEGIGERLSGNYYCNKALHTLDSNGFVIKLTTMKDHANKATGQRTDGEVNTKKARKGADSELFKAVDPVSGRTDYHRR